VVERRVSRLEYFAAGRRQDLTAILHVQRSLQARRPPKFDHNTCLVDSSPNLPYLQSVSAIASASSTTASDNRETMPSRSASSASTTRAVRMRSNDGPAPMMRGSV